MGKFVILFQISGLARNQQVQHCSETLEPGKNGLETWCICSGLSSMHIPCHSCFDGIQLVRETEKRNQRPQIESLFKAPSLTEAYAVGGVAGLA